GDDEREERHRRVERRGEAAGDVLLRPGDQRERREVVHERDGEHYGPEAPRRQAPAGYRYDGEQQQAGDRQPSGDDGRRRHLADDDIDEEKRRAPDEAEQRDRGVVQRTDGRIAGGGRRGRGAGHARIVRDRRVSGT